MAASRAFQVKLYHRRLLPDALADSTSLLLVQILGVGSGAPWPKTDLAVADGPAIARKHPYTQIVAPAEALLFRILLRGWKVSHPATAACITVARLVGAHEA